MKKYIFTLLLALLLVSSALGDATVWNINGRPTSDWFSTANTPRNVALQWMRAIDALVAQGSNPGTGVSYYVDSNVTTEGNGTSWATAKDTLDEAVALCTEDRGDTIHVAQGHAENLAAADAVDLDIAGITIKCYGNGTLAPTFSYTAAGGEFVFGAANIKVEGARFLVATNTVTMGISVEADGDNCSLVNCVFPEPVTAADEFVDAIDLAALAHDFGVYGCSYRHASTTGPAHFIDAGNGINYGLQVVGCDIEGEFSVSAIWSNDIDLRVGITGNSIVNNTAGEHAIEFTAATTGAIEYNAIFTNASGTSIDPGSMVCIQNYVATSINESGMLYPLSAAGAN